ncbi:uncharacterized protein LOC130590186 [Beta vulgaris subsp. vulgaris]|uniref:uncharacterized protein LOC130590186 n=1 Tax=Beta vulgaris subsp. vulgaris TaxID=3555 RepID=UPI0025474495|nr:uncharacterized protein LOC130590186 [Beta vulgaris subsp. vulgaris]
MVYGFNEAKERGKLWEDIERISGSVTGAWVVCGDFNNVLQLNERVGSTVTLEEVAEFRMCLRRAQLQEQTTSGPFYTWSNKQEGEARVFSRIVGLWFFNMWTQADGFLPRVQAVWQQSIQGVPILSTPVKTQEEVHKEPTNAELHKLEEEARKRYVELNKARLSFLHQKAKQEWIKKGDANTGVKNEEGVWQEKSEDIEQAFLGFYQQLLGTRKPTTASVSPTIIREGAILEERHQHELQINSTILCLIPKVAQPVDVTQFRPIACCNVIYKIISKMLCSRLKDVLPHLIDQVQSAFVANRYLVVRALKAFENVSGLEASKEKTAIYFGNVQQEIQNRIMLLTGYKKGSFPFRYLGVPITSKRISRADCDILVEKIMKRIMCWSSRHLSYAGRTTLVNSVLLSLHTYWAQVFLLPKSVLKRITQVCRAFLWEGRSFLQKTPLVAWEGCTWEIFWQIAQKQDLLWIKWIHSVYLHDGDWWEYEAPKMQAGYGRLCNVMVWIGIRTRNQENLYTAWKRWSRSFKSKKRQRVCYSVIAALVYHVWRMRNYSYWNDAVPELKESVEQSNLMLLMFDSFGCKKVL